MRAVEPLGNRVLGVIDHCRMDLFAFASREPDGIEVNHGAWGNDPDNFGDGSWAEASFLGTDQFWFVEDCIMTTPISNSVAVSGDSGARVVFRHNALSGGFQIYLPAESVDTVAGHTAPQRSVTTTAVFFKNTREQ